MLDGIIKFTAILRWHFLSRLTDTPSHLPDLYEASITELRKGLEQNLFTSVRLVKVKDFYPMVSFLLICT